MIVGTAVLEGDHALPVIVGTAVLECDNALPVIVGTAVIEGDHALPMIAGTTVIEGDHALPMVVETAGELECDPALVTVQALVHALPPPLPLPKITDIYHNK